MSPPGRSAWQCEASMLLRRLEGCWGEFIISSTWKFQIVLHGYIPSKSMIIYTPKKRCKWIPGFLDHVGVWQRSLLQLVLFLDQEPDCWARPINHDFVPPIKLFIEGVNNILDFDGRLIVLETLSGRSLWNKGIVVMLRAACTRKYQPFKILKHARKNVQTHSCSPRHVQSALCRPSSFPLP